jgi:hypothetical protein
MGDYVLLKNETLVATNANGEVMLGDYIQPSVRITTGITIDETFAGKIIEADGTFTINFPDNLPIGTKVDVVNIGRGIITLTATSLLSDGDRLETQYSAASLYFRGNRTWVAVGELTNDPDFKYFVTEWYVSGDDDGRTVMLPLPDFGEYNATVDWGDGTPVQNITAYNVNNTHTYTNAGTYYIKISGHCTGWYFSHVGHSRCKIRSVKYWGTSDGFSGFTYLNFRGCWNLKSTGRGKILPYGNVTELFEIFDNCRSLTGVTAGIFDLCTEMTYNAFLKSFYNCYDLSFIPDDLFRYNTQVESFESTFENCYNLRTIPDGLFAHNPYVYTFQAVFNNCYKLSINPKTFYLSDSDRATRFLNQSVDFSRAFMPGGYWYGSVKGTAPDLWNCDFGSGTPTKTDCFKYHSANSLTNYNDIPTDWR